VRLVVRARRPADFAAHHVGLRAAFGATLRPRRAAVLAAWPPWEAEASLRAAR
jgi:hypothetical protein